MLWTCVCASIVFCVPCLVARLRVSPGVMCLLLVYFTVSLPLLYALAFRVIKKLYKSEVESCIFLVLDLKIQYFGFCWI